MDMVPDVAGATATDSAITSADTGIAPDAGAKSDATATHAAPYATDIVPNDADAAPDATDAVPNNTDAVPNNTGAAPNDAGEAPIDADAAPIDAGVASNDAGLVSNDAANAQLIRKPTFLIPFIPGVSERLKKIASGYNVRTWYTFPGRISDWFTKYWGWQHPSKAQHTVYCAMCSCGIQYVGESERNLKVRLAEHT